jgi:hypothetical protein
MEYLKKTRGDLFDERGRATSDTLAALLAVKYHRDMCSKMAHEDIDNFTKNVSRVLGMQFTTHCKSEAVSTRGQWIISLTQDSSQLQLKRVLFAWLYIRKVYYKSIMEKAPDELFEKNFMEKYSLRYKDGYKTHMKKNTKTAIRLLYGRVEQNAKNNVLRYVKEALGINPSITVPRGNEFKKGIKNYRRDQETFFIGRKNQVGGYYEWEQVTSFLVLDSML